MSLPMLGVHDLPLFVASCVLLNLTPGADTLFVVTRSAALGRRAGVAAALGIGAGCCVHVLAAALGLSALLAASATAFEVVKWLGALYLVYLGATMLWPRGRSEAAATRVAPVRSRSVFVQGLLTNVLNPKVALFFLAFMPQFIEPSAPGKPLAFLVLGAIFVCTGTVWCLLLAWMSARVSARAAQVGEGAAGWTRWLSRACGGLFIGLGVRLAASPAP